MAARLQAVALTLLVLVSGAAADWFDAQATVYTGPGSGGDAGSCGFGNINSRFATGRNFCAWPNNDGSKCGKCLEIKCDGRAVTNAWRRSWDYPKYQCNGRSVIVMVTDTCPSNVNQEWCSGFIPHCDLSWEAISQIVKNVDGIAATKMRWVDCPGAPAKTCGQPLKAFDTCGDANGPYKDKCCGPYLKCNQKSPFYWKCEGDSTSNWNNGRGSSGPSDGGGSWNSGGSRSYVVKSDDNRRKRGTTGRRRNSTPQSSSGGSKAISRWGQCGGLGGPTGNRQGGRDGQWAGYYCRQGSCRRSNSWFWQCA